MVAPTNSGLLSTKSRSSRHSEKSPAPKPVRSTRLSQSEGMIWSVSTSVRSRGTARPVTMTTGSISRRSSGVANVPATAVAAATAGETRWVRPPRPWRPSKLRFEVEAQRSPTASLSGFMARHMEQPGSRHSKPAAVKTLSSPSASACAFTRCEPGTASARRPVRTVRPSSTAAAARKSSMRELVQLPRNTVSTLISRSGVPASSPM